MRAHGRSLNEPVRVAFVVVATQPRRSFVLVARSFTIHLNKTVAAKTKVAWFVVN
jgi:hypothetical protein